jgi:hypothetical protein
VAVPAIACLLVLECYLGGQWKRWNKGTHHNDDDNDYCHRALSFVVVVTRRFSPLVCTIWLPQCQHDMALASGKKKKMGRGQSILT